MTLISPIRTFASVKKTIAALLELRKPVVLNKNDVREWNVRGFGPGGQAVNKTNNAVRLIHEPTGISVKCHKTRDLVQNRKHAFKLLISALDRRVNGHCSLEAIASLKLRSQNHVKSQKSTRKHGISNDS